GLHPALAVDVRDRQRKRPALLLRPVHDDALRARHPRQRARAPDERDMERLRVRGISPGPRLRRPAGVLPGLRHALDVLIGRPAAIPVAAAGLAFALAAWTLLQRAAALQLPAYDTAFFEQLVWNLGHGRGLVSGFFPASFLGLHFSPFLALPALLE